MMFFFQKGVHRVALWSSEDTLPDAIMSSNMKYCIFAVMNYKVDISMGFLP